MKRKTSYLVVCGALAAILAVAAIAQAIPHDPMGRHMPIKRTDLQAKIGEQFALADANHDGFITKAEFAARREAVRQEFDARRTEHRGERFAMLDKNHDGTISKDEYMAPPPEEDHRGGPDGGAGVGRGHHDRHFIRGHMGLNMGMGEKWFDRADANHDGKLTLAEASFGPLAMFDRADTNHDGTLSPQEAGAARAAFRDQVMKDRRK